MKKNSGDSGSKNLLQQFAVKSNKKKVAYNNRSVIYNRCSTEKQDSLEWQDNVCANFCGQINLALIKCFGEKESATTDDRKVFREMLKFCEKEDIGHIVIYSYDRFSRTGDINLLKELREKGIRVHAATQSVDDNTPSGRFSQSIYLMFAQMENEQRREKIIEGQKSKLRKGEWIGKPTLGYEKRFITGKKEHDHDKQQCFIDNKGKLLRQAFLWKHNENLSNVEIIDRLKQMGLTLSPPQLTRIFRNPFYCGYITCTLLDDGELIRGKHEPLISEEIFLKVNCVVNENPHGWKMLRQNDEMPLKASVQCGICRRPLTAYPQKGKYIYYKCPNNGCCVNISSKKLHQLFSEELSKFIVNPQIMPIIKRQLESTYWMLHNNEAAREKPMKDELARLKNELEVMEFNHITSKVSPELYQKFSVSHTQKIAAIDCELKNLNQDSSNLEMHLNKVLKYAGNLLELWRLLDCIGKVRLQKLIYPCGLLYLHENHQLRTDAVNPIFSAITSISMILQAEENTEQRIETTELHQLYLMFASSNFFWQNLTEIQIYINEMEKLYPKISQNVTHMSVSDSTEAVKFGYTSDTTGTNITQGVNSPMTGSTIFTGTTNQLSFIR